MNYFAHGLRFVDQPYVLAGTAAPDWLSVVDRKVRLRPQRVEPVLQVDGPAGRVALGVRLHADDDFWFHRTRAFVETTSELADLFRTLLDGDGRHRTGLLGHVCTELLLDAVLIEEHPERLEQYYAALTQVDPWQVQQAVNRMSRRPTQRLAPFIPLFAREQVLRDYATGERLLFRLNQVMRRIKLEPLPPEMAELLDRGRAVVRRRARELLPPERFSFPTGR